MPGGAAGYREVTFKQNGAFGNYNPAARLGAA
jgi:hypothetical protein